MALEQKIPKELIALPVKALANDQHPAPQFDAADLGIAKCGLAPKSAWQLRTCPRRGCWH
jgi:hypothetical protein